MLRIKVVTGQIKSGTPEQKEAALWAVASALLLGGSPLLLTTLLLSFAGRISRASLGTVFLDGELLVLTNAIIATSTMLIGKRRRGAQNFPGGEFFILMGFLLFAFSTACFAWIRISEVIGYTGGDWEVVAAAVVLLFLLSALYSYYLFLLESVIAPQAIDPERELDAAEAEMERKRAGRKDQRSPEEPQ
jgi:hypothetical protein